MRAFAVLSFGDQPELVDLPIPAADGGFRVRVNIAGVNPVDHKMVGRLTAGSSFPFVLGVDFAGVLEEVPPSEMELRVGDRVFGMARQHGSYAEYTALPASSPNLPTPIARIPDDVTDEQAAALPVAAVAAIGSLELLGTGAGQRLVVTGAAGAVGGYAVQMAKHRGAHVIATVRSAARGLPSAGRTAGVFPKSGADEARRLGADEVFESGDGDVVTAILAAHPDGVDAVLDNVSDEVATRRDAELLGPGRRLVSTVHAADESWFADHQITARNISGPANPFASPAGLSELARLVADGTIDARVRTVVPLDEALQIHDRLRQGGLSGKALIRI
ncbi:MAG TPA: zinc-binding dehydrogenase [Streptosporangiaceae bacterium]|jgi:NADPH:quinone reductase-like Zn-dependent oxidoreductase